MLPNKLVWVFFWIFAVAFVVDGAVNPNNWFVNVNDPTNDDVPSKVTGKIGDDLKIECKIPNFELKFFAWKFCASECRSPAAVWKMVVKVDYGETEILNRTKFDMAPDGSLILKDIQPHNDRNWVRCFHKKQFVGLDHRSTIIFVAQEPVITSENPKEYVVIENMPFVMFCEGRGYPIPWVAWIWNGLVLQNNTNGPTYLLRRRATAEEAGIYTCKAGNMAGVTSFDYQLTVRADCLARESTAAAPQTHSTVQRPTSAESMLSSKASSAGPTRKANQKSISLGEGVTIGIGIAIAVGIALATVWCVKRNWENRPRVTAVQLQGNSTSDNDFTSDDEAVDVAGKNA